VQGGSTASASARGSGSNTASVYANASVVADNLSVTVAGPLNVGGGVSAHASGSASNSAAAKALAVVNANTQVRANSNLSVAVNSGDLTVTGGDNANAAGDFVFRTTSATTNSNADLSSGGDASITVAAVMFLSRAAA
jgi:hypothetical protein